MCVEKQRKRRSEIWPRGLALGIHNGEDMSTHTKPCPRCERGRMLKYDDQYGEYWSCANCGRHEDLDESVREPLPYVRMFKAKGPTLPVWLGE